MPLSAGTRIGPYVIEASLGAGGMGEVYRARGTRLDRDVAIKLLPDLPITYRQLTFQRGFISAARFAPDGHTILYSASWADEPIRVVYSTRSRRDGVTAAVGAQREAPVRDDAGEMTILVAGESARESRDVDQLIAVPRTRDG